jgi:hypothetical protein
MIVDCWQGGHGLPQKVTEKTQLTPARSAHRIISLPPDVSTRIIQTCQNNGISFGNAYPIIAQVAAARLLLNHYLKGKVDEDEWDFRKKEPMYSFGLVDLRPFLEPAACLAIDFYCHSIAFLPLGQASKLKPGMTLPAVGNLLTRERFFYRAKLVQNRAKALLGNPLFLEIGDSVMAQRRGVESPRERALKWRANVTPDPVALNDRVLTPQELAAGFVVLNGGSSLGNVSCVSIYRFDSHTRLDGQNHTS